MIGKTSLLMSVALATGCVSMLRESAVEGEPTKFERVALVIHPGVMDQKAVAPDLEPLRRAIKEQLAEEGVDVRIALAPSAHADGKESTHVLRLRAIQHTTGRTADSVQWSIQVDQERTTDAVRAFAPIYKMTSVAPYCQKPVWGEEEGQVRCYKDWTKDVLETLREKGFLEDESTTKSGSNSASDFVAPNVDGAG